MQMKPLWIVLVLSFSLGVSACATGGPKQTAGTLIGAGAGAALGSQIGGGQGSLLGAGVGAALGAYGGNLLGKNLDAADR